MIGCQCRAPYIPVEYLLLFDQLLQRAWFFLPAYVCFVRVAHTLAQECNLVNVKHKRGLPAIDIDLAIATAMIRRECEVAKFCNDKVFEEGVTSKLTEFYGVVAAFPASLVTCCRQYTANVANEII